MKFNPTAAILGMIGATMVPVAASAHPKLVAATPAANASAARTRIVTLTFSERLMPKMSGAALMMTGMPGMTHHRPMKMPGVTSKIGANGKSIVLTAAKPLPAGTYQADWFVVSSDTHRITGAHKFSVK